MPHTGDILSTVSAGWLTGRGEVSDPRFCLKPQTSFADNFGRNSLLDRTIRALPADQQSSEDRHQSLVLHLRPGISERDTSVENRLL